MGDHHGLALKKTGVWVFIKILIRQENNYQPKNKITELKKKTKEKRIKVIVT